MEIWKDVVGYEGLYQVSNKGNVRSLDHYASNGFKEILYKGRVLKWNRNKKGYWSVMLCKQGKPKRFYVHRLVAEMFIPNPHDLPEINHKDENQLNNCVENLEWCNRKYNLTYGTLQERSAKTRGHSVKQYTLEGNFVKEYRSARNAAEALGKPHGGMPIQKCCQGTQKTAYGYIWRYKEAE